MSGSMAQRTFCAFFAKVRECPQWDESRHSARIRPVYPGVQLHSFGGGEFQHRYKHRLDGVRLKRLLPDQIQGVAPLDSLNFPSFRSNEMRGSFRRGVQSDLDTLKAGLPILRTVERPVQRATVAHVSHSFF